MESFILYGATLLVTWILGYFAKKSNYISNHLIPIQNLLIGIIVTVVYWLITKDFEAALMVTGSLAGGLYDIVHNLEKLIGTKKIQTTFNEDDLENIDTESEGLMEEPEEEEMAEEEIEEEEVKEE